MDVGYYDASAAAAYPAITLHGTAHMTKPARGGTTVKILHLIHSVKSQFPQYFLSNQLFSSCAKVLAIREKERDI